MKDMINWKWHLGSWFCVSVIACVILGMRDPVRPVGRCSVTRKVYSPPYTTTIMVISGKSVIPVITHQPERYSIDLWGKSDDGVDAGLNVTISSGEYEATVVGDTREVGKPRASTAAVVVLVLTAGAIGLLAPACLLMVDLVRM